MNARVDSDDAVSTKGCASMPIAVRSAPFVFRTRRIVEARRRFPSTRAPVRQERAHADGDDRIAIAQDAKETLTTPTPLVRANRGRRKRVRHGCASFAVSVRECKETDQTWWEDVWAGLTPRVRETTALHAGSALFRDGPPPSLRFGGRTDIWQPD